MTASRRNKLLIGVGALVGLVIVALLVAPRLIDVNAYKAAVVAEVKKATGRELVIEGPIHLSLLPTPVVSTTGVRFSNAAGARGAQMVDMKSVSVSPSLWGLLLGRIEVGELVLVEPKIVLEPGGDGRPNWQFSPQGASDQPAGAPSKGLNISIGRLAIENGTLSFTDPQKGVAVTAEKVNVEASVGSMAGPFSLSGGAVVNGTPLKIDATIDASEGAGHAAEFKLETDSGKLAFDGTLGDLTPDARLLGNVTVKASSLTGFLASLLAAAGHEAPTWPPGLAGKFSFEGEVEKSPDTLAARDFKIAIDDDKGAGSVSLTFSPAIVVDVRLVLPRLNLDKWAAELAAPDATGATGPAISRKAAPPAGAASQKDEAGSSAAAWKIPNDLTATVALAVAEVAYNKAAVQNLSLGLEIRNGVVAVPRLSAMLPGEMALEAKSTITGDAAHPRVEGDFSLVGTKLRETLAWLKVDLSGVPKDKLAKLSLRGKMASRGPTDIEVTDAAFELDDLKGTGGVVATLGVPLSIVTNVRLDTVDVDSYLPKAEAGGKPASATASAVPASKAPLLPEKAIGPLLGLKARIDKLIYRQETFGGVDADVAVQGNVLRVNDVKVASLLGARAAMRGRVIGYATPAPRFEMGINLDAPDIDRLMKFSGVGGVKGPVGAMTASGVVQGTRTAVALRDFKVNVLGAAMEATGTLTLSGAQKFDLSKISVKIEDPGRLAAALTGARGDTGIGPVALSGAIAGSPENVNFKGDIQVKGATVAASIDARLAGRPSITADLRVPGTLDLDKVSASAPAARGAPARSGASAADHGAGNAPALPDLDATVRLTVGTLVMAPMRIGDADIAATLKNRVLTLSHFKGRLFGGALDLNGTVNGTTPAMAFDVRGSATGMSLGEMLRATAGSNVFGGKLRATIDGRLDATALEMRGSGENGAAIKRSLAGGTTLGGYVSVGVDKAFLALGSIASGVAGTADSAIDDTIGSVLSGVTGQRIGLDLGAEASAIIVIVNRFANHNSPISGRVNIASGTATTNNLVLQGNRATAHIDSRTNLAASTTDTKVTFYVAEKPSQVFLTTSARGSTSSPSLSVARGPAAPSSAPSQHQQPGVTLPGVGRVPLPNLPGLPNIFGR